MNSEDELQNYIENPKYGSGASFPTLCFGIVITKTKENNGSYEYKIRMNLSSSSTVRTNHQRTNELVTYPFYTLFKNLI